MELLEICRNAKEVSRQIGTLGTDIKNQALLAVADALVANTDGIMQANALDLSYGRANHMPTGLLDRLMLDEKRSV